MKMKKSAVMFITIIILIIITIIGLFLGTLAIKQIRLNREILWSGLAIFGADAAIEKNLYHLIKEGEAQNNCSNDPSNWNKLGNDVYYCLKFEGDSKEPTKLIGQGYYRGVIRALEVNF